MMSFLSPKDFELSVKQKNKTHQSHILSKALNNKPPGHEAFCLFNLEKIS